MTTFCIAFYVILRDVEYGSYTDEVDFSLCLSCLCPRAVEVETSCCGAYFSCWEMWVSLLGRFRLPVVELSPPAVWAEFSCCEGWVLLLWRLRSCCWTLFILLCCLRSPVLRKRLTSLLVEAEPFWKNDWTLLVLSLNPLVIETDSSWFWVWILLL